MNFRNSRNSALITSEAGAYLRVAATAATTLPLEAVT